MTWMTGSGLLLPLVGSHLPLMGPCFLAGIGAAPSFSSGFSLLGRRTTGAAEGMSWASSGMGAGTTIGAFSGGWPADLIPDPRVAHHTRRWHQQDGPTVGVDEAPSHPVLLWRMRFLGPCSSVARSFLSGSLRLPGVGASRPRATAWL